MKIGLSFSRCLRDIYEGKVDEDKVLVIISRTMLDPRKDSSWNKVWEGYTQGGHSHPEWKAHADKYDEFRRLAVRLVDSGKLHQPRKFGAAPTRTPYYWLDCVVPIDEIEDIPAVKQAWEHYLMVANLCS